MLRDRSTVIPTKISANADDWRFDAADVDPELCSAPGLELLLEPELRTGFFSSSQ